VPITRTLALQAAGREKIPVKFQSISVSELSEVEEAFLTGSSRSVLPVRQIDACQVGAGKPGFVTETVSRAFWRELRARLVEI
jgi:branched-subunit amino acid aminotransferase/4-amino-4-deoxychorismate lyase